MVAAVSAATNPKALGPSLTLAICSNRCENIERHWLRYLRCLGPQDKPLIIFDDEETPRVSSLIAKLVAAGVQVLVNGTNLGLSDSRNIALEECSTDYLVFIDDDVLLSRATIEYMRREFRRGAEIVGVRITGPEKAFNLPWYITEGQFHYLALHNPRSLTLNTWGACMGLDVSFVKNNHLKFNDKLGRKGRALQCGEDTTFLQQMKLKGARETFLREAQVVHSFDRGRLTIRYMLRRAYWQGRSEFRRKNSLSGLRKEWIRFFDSDAHVLKKVLLASVYITLVLAGISSEFLLRSGRSISP